RTLRVYTALDDLHGQFAAVVEQLLARPHAAPFRIVDLAAQAGGLAMLVETEASHGVQVALHGHEAIEGGPQAVTANGKDQRIDLALALPFDDINGAVALAALDGSDVLFSRKHSGQRGVLGRHQR